MALKVDIPGHEPLELEHVLLDQNGTLSDRGTAIDGVAERLARVAQRLRVHVLSADTFGTLDSCARMLAIEAHRVASGDEKLAFTRSILDALDLLLDERLLIATLRA